MTETDQNCLKKDLSSYGQILCVEMSPFNLSQDLILIGFKTKILLGYLKLDDRLNLDILAEFKNFAHCTCLSISPETSLSALPNVILFAAAGSDHKLRVFKSNLDGEDTCKVLSEHTSYINDAKYDPDNNYLVSVSDDNSARVWETENYDCVATLRLDSPGMSICWHREDNKLLIAEKIGLIRFYNVENQCPILSLDYGKSLSSAHWAPAEPQLVGSLQCGEILIWDLSKPTNVLSSNLVFTENGGHLRFNSTGELVAAVNHVDGHLKVVSVHNNQQQSRLNAPVSIPTNVTWHFRCPIVCVGDYTSLNFWRISSGR